MLGEYVKRRSEGMLAHFFVQVITSVTYRTHPEPSHIQVAFVQANATTNSTLRPVLERSLGALVNMTDAGYTGYGYLSNGFSGIFIRPGGTAEELIKGIAAFQEIGQSDGVSFIMANVTFPRWIDYCDAILQDPNIAMNVMDASRLLTPDMAFNKADQIVDMMLEFGEDHYPSFNFSEYFSYQPTHMYSNMQFQSVKSIRLGEIILQFTPPGRMVALS